MYIMSVFYIGYFCNSQEEIVFKNDLKTWRWFLKSKLVVNIKKKIALGPILYNTFNI